MGSEPFVLDRAENPHPRMLREALYYRSIQHDSTSAAALWYGYLIAMCGATGCTPAELNAWLDSHPDEVPQPSPVAVKIRGR